MPNIELVRVIFIYYKVFKFHVPGSIPFSGKTEMQKHGITETHADSDEYSCILQKRIYKNNNNNNNNNNNIGLIIEVALYVAQAVFSLRALFGATMFF